MTLLKISKFQRGVSGVLAILLFACLITVFFEGQLNQSTRLVFDVVFIVIAIFAWLYLISIFKDSILKELRGPLTLPCLAIIVGVTEDILSVVSPDSRFIDPLLWSLPFLVVIGTVWIRLKVRSLRKRTDGTS